MLRPAIVSLAGRGVMARLRMVRGARTAVGLSMVIVRWRARVMARIVVSLFVRTVMAIVV